MAGIELAPAVLNDFDRFINHLTKFHVDDTPSRVAEIVESIQILSHSPMIGRMVKGGHRELVIGQGSHGYVALYRFVPSIDTVFVLAIRSQRENAFKRRRTLQP